MRPLVFVEHHGGELPKGPLGVLAKATALSGDGPAAILVGGDEVEGLSSQLGAYGATRVHVANSPTLESSLPQPRVDVIAQVVRDEGYDTVLFSNSVLAADIAAGLAARLEAGLNWDLIDVLVTDDGLVGKRPALGDSVLVDVGWRSETRLAVFRPGSFEAIEVNGGTPDVRAVTVELQPHSSGTVMVEHRAQTDSGPSLEDAEIIVAGGMGLGAAEHFAMANELASALGGVVGASRAAVYAGWYPYSGQVGQTGKTVSPRLYIALGISGAIQHKVGMQSSKVIISINKDRAAPIFEFSDLAVVGDVHKIVPRLTELIRKHRQA